MREITCSTITDAIKKMCIEAATILPQDVEKALSQKHDEEDSVLAQKTLQVLMDNARKTNAYLSRYRNGFCLCDNGTRSTYYRWQFK